MADVDITRVYAETLINFRRKRLDMLLKRARKLVDEDRDLGTQHNYHAISVSGLIQNLEKVTSLYQYGATNESGSELNLSDFTDAVKRFIDDIDRELDLLESHLHVALG